MVYKNKDTKIKIYYYRKLIFSILILIYITGLCTGCSFAVKNADNFNFVQKVTLVEKLINSANTGILGQTATLIIRDTVLIILITVLKYSGILKGLCILIPFIMSIQDSCIYTVIICQNKTGYFKLIFHYILKNTAIVFLVLTYCFIVIFEIIQQRNNPQKDVKRLFIYVTGIIFIYIIDITVKGFIYPLR